METGCSAGTPNLPHVTEIDPAPHLSDSKLSLLQGSVLLRPLFKAPLPYLFITWLTRCVYLTQHTCLQGNLEISKGRAIYSSDDNDGRDKDGAAIDQHAKITNLDLFC